MKQTAPHADKAWSGSLVALFMVTTVGLGIQTLVEVRPLAPYFLPFLAILIGVVLSCYFSQYLPVSRKLAGENLDMLARYARWFQLTMISSSSIAVFASAMIGYLYHHRAR